MRSDHYRRPRNGGKHASSMNIRQVFLHATEQPPTQFTITCCCAGTATVIVHRCSFFAFAAASAHAVSAS